MKRIFLIISILLIPALCWAIAPDRRISDADGDVLAISSTGVITVVIASGSDIVLENGEIIRNSTNGLIELISEGSTITTTSTTGLVISQTENLIPSTETSDPCSAEDEGNIFWNTTANELCVCDGTNDVRVTDASTACF